MVSMVGAPDSMAGGGGGQFGGGGPSGGGYGQGGFQQGEGLTPYLATEAVSAVAVALLDQVTVGCTSSNFRSTCSCFWLCPRASSVACQNVKGRAALCRRWPAQHPLVQPGPARWPL